YISGYRGGFERFPSGVSFAPGESADNDGPRTARSGPARARTGATRPRAAQRSSASRARRAGRCAGNAMHRPAHSNFPLVGAPYTMVSVAVALDTGALTSIASRVRVYAPLGKESLTANSSGSCSV